jgi:hypothetical protein
LAGGSKKGVYRLTLDDGVTAVLYMWSEAENYWPVRAGQEVAYPFADAPELDLFRGGATTDTPPSDTPGSPAPTRTGKPAHSNVRSLTDTHDTPNSLQPLATRTGAGR